MADTPPTCAAIGCSDPCAPKTIMCAFHWRRVPHNAQRAVLDLLQRQIDRESDEWARAFGRAIQTVALKAGKSTIEIEAHPAIRQMRIAEDREN